MLSQTHLSTLLSILSSDKTLHDISTLVRQSFPKSQCHQVKVACSMTLLAQDGVLSPSQMLATLYTLYDLHKSEPIGNHPYLSVLLALIDSDPVPVLTTCERQFLLKLVLCQSTEFDDIVPQAHLNSFDDTVPFEAPALDSIRSMVCMSS
jgi:hypothetical protein